MALSETARRIRAAAAYGGFKGRDELAEAIETSKSTLQRIEGVAQPKRKPKRPELLAIAEACGVPMWFLEEGWEGWRKRSAIDREGHEAMDDLERRRSNGEDVAADG